MSLRDLGVFNPLPAGHPLLERGRSESARWAPLCWKCHRAFAVGSRVTLNLVETPDETGDLTVRAEPVCATCALKGKEILTPLGRRIVLLVKDGDASPFPVVTTDGKQWRDDEVSPA